MPMATKHVAAFISWRAFEKEGKIWLPRQLQYFSFPLRQFKFISQVLSLPACSLFPIGTSRIENAADKEYCI